MSERRFGRDRQGRSVFLPLHAWGRRGCVIPDAERERRLRRAVRFATAIEGIVLAGGALGVLAVGLHWAWALLLLPLVFALRLAVDRALARGLEEVAMPLPSAWSLREQAMRYSPWQIRRWIVVALLCGIGSLWLLRGGAAPSLGAVGLALSAIATLTLLAMLGARARAR